MATNNERITLKEAFADALEARGFTIERLAEAADIPERYLRALRDGNTKHLPAAPYIRGYLMRIGEVLGVDGVALWRLYKNEHPVRASGTDDKLPVNRFAMRSIRRRTVVFGIAGIIVILYFVWRLPELVGTPTIDIVTPAVSNLVVNASPIHLAGKVDPRDRLYINGEEISVGSDGQFAKDFMLETGANAIEFRAVRFLGRERKVTRQVIYQP